MSVSVCKEEDDSRNQLEDRESVGGMRVTYLNDSLNSQPCNYKRGGWCLSCKRYGQKGLMVTKRWERMKSGLCGYVIKKKVTWKCLDPSTNDVFSSDSESTVRDDISNSELGGILRGLSSNFTVEGTSASVKRAVTDSLEPRMHSKRTRLC